MLGTGQTYAQKFSAMVNINALTINNVQPNVDSLSVSAEGTTDLSLNLRLFLKEKWAIRVGAGLERLRYTVNNGDVSTNYEAIRSDLKGILGFERHFKFSRFDFYPGVFVPIIVVGDDKIQDNFENIKNGGVRAGFGVLAGLNVKIIGPLRAGVEFDTSFDSFKGTVWEAAQSQSTVPFRGLTYNLAITLGVQI